MPVQSMVEPSGSSGCKRDRVSERALALETLWRETGLPSVRNCGKLPLGGGLVAVKASGRAGAGRTAGFGGLQTCGSTWACPECSAKIAHTRKAELHAAQKEARRRGWTIAHVTMTMRHHNGQALKDLWDALSYAWGAATSGRAWQAEKLLFGVQGWVRLVEVTHGENGWHVHVHSLIFSDAKGFGRNPGNLASLMFVRWAAALKRKTMKAPLIEHGGLKVRVLGGQDDDLSDYFTKNVYAAESEEKDLERLALEMARGDLKDAKDGNRTPFKILEDVVTNGDAQDLALWHEWERGSKGRRQMTWSRGLRDDLVQEPELSDEEIAQQDVGGDVVVLLTGPTWKAICREKGTRSTVRSMACMDDTGDVLRAYLGARGWEWVEPLRLVPVDVGALETKRLAP